MTNLNNSSNIRYGQTTVDFGSSPSYDSYFTITDVGITTSSLITVSRDGSAASGQDADENELADFSMTATPGSGSFSLYMQCQDGLVAGKYIINYSYR